MSTIGNPKTFTLQEEKDHHETYHTQGMGDLENCLYCPPPGYDPDNCLDQAICGDRGVYCTNCQPWAAKVKTLLMAEANAA